MRYNDNTIEIPEVITDVVTEPVPLEALKRQLNMLFDTSAGYEFNDDDILLTQKLKAARERVENYTGLTLAPKTLRVPVRNEQGGVEIPYGPITSVTSMKDADGITIADYSLRGNQFKEILSPCSCYLLIEYQAGYTNCPAQLQEAILQEAVDLYTNRGDGQQEYAAADISICKRAMELAAPYKRKSGLA